MNTEDIIFKLQSRLPEKSPYFSDRLDIASITLAGSTVTVATAIDHNLNTGDLVLMGGVLSPVEIDSFVVGATETTITTVTDHDLTLNSSIPYDLTQQVQITGTGFDESYLLVDVPNRRTFVIKNGVALPATVVFLQEQGAGYNGLKTVTVTSATTFTYELDFVTPEPNHLDSSYVYKGMRISGAVSIEVIEQSYSAQELDNVWAFVVLGEFSANKDRRTDDDAITTEGRQNDFRQKIIQNFDVYLYIPNKGNILTDTNGRAGRDLVEAIRVPLFQSILGENLESPLNAQGERVVTYTGDAPFLYNGAYYIHQIGFQQVVEITAADTAIESFNRAFRDIDVTHRNQFSDLAVYTSFIDLDDEPL